MGIKLDLFGWFPSQSLPSSERPVSPSCLWHCSAGTLCCCRLRRVLCNCCGPDGSRKLRGAFDLFALLPERESEGGRPALPVRSEEVPPRRVWRRPENLPGAESVAAAQPVSLPEENEREWPFPPKAPFPRHIPPLAPSPVPDTPPPPTDQPLSQTPGMAFQNLHLFVTWLSFTEHWLLTVLKTAKQ